MLKKYTPSDEPIAAARGIPDGFMSAAEMFFADVSQETAMTFTCGASTFVVAPRRMKSSGHLQIILADMQTIAEGLAIMRHIMRLGSTQSIVTWVHEGEPLHDLGPVPRSALTTALKGEGWGLTIDGHIWKLERL